MPNAVPNGLAVEMLPRMDDGPAGGAVVAEENTNDGVFVSGAVVVVDGKLEAGGSSPPDEDPDVPESSPG